MRKPFTIVHKQSKVEHLDRYREDQINAQLRYAREEYEAKHDSQPSIHPYEGERIRLSALAFAEHILKSEGMVIWISGIEFVDGKKSSPLLKMREANRVLKQLGLKQIARSRDWLV
jgi:hypothetical protein